MPTGKNTKNAPRSLPWRTADYLKTDADIAAYIEAMLEDGDPQDVPIALRTVADAVGGMAALAKKTGLSRETLYRTLSDRGNPRLDTLITILHAFGLRFSVRPVTAKRARGRQSARA
jgi:probable addiction module antidote protein